MTDEAASPGQRIQRKGQTDDPRVSPAYRLVQELEHFYIAEYCGSWRLLDKSDYEKVPV